MIARMLIATAVALCTQSLTTQTLPARSATMDELVSFIRSARIEKAPQTCKVSLDSWYAAQDSIDSVSIARLLQPFGSDPARVIDKTMVIALGVGVCPDVALNDVLLRVYGTRRNDIRSDVFKQVVSNLEGILRRRSAIPDEWYYITASYKSDQVVAVFGTYRRGISAFIEGQESELESRLKVDIDIPGLPTIYGCYGPCELVDDNIVYPAHYGELRWALLDVLSSRSKNTDAGRPDALPSANTWDLR